MEKQILSVKQLLGNAKFYNGSQVMVEGLFLASFYNSVLIPLAENIETPNTKLIINIDHPGLVDKCFAALSPYIGGEYYYIDRAIITGTFFNDGSPVVTSVLEMQIIRDDKAFKISLN